MAWLAAASLLAGCGPAVEPGNGANGQMGGTMGNDHNAGPPITQLSAERALFRGAASGAMRALGYLRLCRQLRELDPAAVDEIASREAALARAERRAAEAGLEADWKAVRTELVMEWSRARRGCVARDLRLGEELRLFDEAARLLEERTRTVEAARAGPALPGAREGHDRERAHLRAYYQSVRSWSGLAAQCANQRVTGPEGAEEEQARLRVRTEAALDRARGAGLQWDLDVAVADRSPPAYPTPAVHVCNPVIYANALDQWAHNLEQLELLLGTLGAGAQG